MSVCHKGVCFLKRIVYNSVHIASQFQFGITCVRNPAYADRSSCAGVKMYPLSVNLFCLIVATFLIRCGHLFFLLWEENLKVILPLS